ncbi:MAG: PIG-L family deacetylase [Deltaproteobacteria bacterium]|uniref:PIG-L family deacetylase n=1 Tax=Candidatus Zymogenus saltonus TaxID=2844893 RepID=A0A9D8KK03_9DELT|nr:PIG-L family deacetylase [Candidatus Zymogenus saltonus]
MKNTKDRILVVAPHADDETIGMGGTIARLVDEGNIVTVAVMTGHGEVDPHPLWPSSLWETIRGEFREAMEILGVTDYIFREIPAVMVADQKIHELNKITGDIIEEIKPDILYIPFINDLHKDHRELFHSFSVHWRPHLPLGRKMREVYAYETVSETHLNFPYVEGGFIPNAFVDISGYIEVKLSAMARFKSQIIDFPHPRSIEAVRALAAWRGSQISAQAAEAFVMVRRIV